MIINFSGQTKAQNVQDEIEAKVSKRKRSKQGLLYLPDGGREHEIIFIDDMNMPQKEEYGAQPPIELLRQWMDYGGWYELKDMTHVYL